MGKATKLLKDISGKVGSLMFKQTKSGKTSVYAAPDVKETPTRTKAQMLGLMAWVTLIALFKMFRKTLKHSHENLLPGRSDYNAFLADNTKNCRAYLTKTEFRNGGCLLIPCQISQGSLESINYEKNGSNVLVTDIPLGSLVIDANTTIGDLSAVLEANNPDEWLEGDQLTFFYGQQKVDAVTGTPRAKITGYKMKLDIANDTPLWDVVSALGFTSVPEPVEGGYVLGMSQVITDGAAAWIHSREDEEGNLRIGTQSLYVDSSILATYTGDTAFQASANSYGGITDKQKVFLRPDEDTNTVRVAVESVNTGGSEQSGGGSGSSSGSSGSNSGTSGTSGTGGQQSGGSQETPTVAAPVISGSTPFEETTQVTMSCSTAGATIHYTVDGTTPTAESTQYTEAITLSETTTVKAIAIKDGVSSSVTSRTYTKGTNAGGGDGEGSGDME